MNTEYEYSFKVTDINPFINFIKNNNFKKQEKTKEERTLYTKEDQTIARITIKNDTKIYLDFKTENDKKEILKESKETIPVEIDDINKALSIIDFLGYKKHKTLKRTRTVYTKENIKFEIDNYTHPEKMYVVAVEGEKNATDNIYNKISKELKDYFQ